MENNSSSEYSKASKSKSDDAAEEAQKELEQLTINDNDSTSEAGIEPAVTKVDENAAKDSEKRTPELSNDDKEQPGERSGSPSANATSDITDTPAKKRVSISATATPAPRQYGMIPLGKDALIDMNTVFDGPTQADDVPTTSDIMKPSAEVVDETSSKRIDPCDYIECRRERKSEQFKCKNSNCEKKFHKICYEKEYLWDIKGNCLFKCKGINERKCKQNGKLAKRCQYNMPCWKREDPPPLRPTCTVCKEIYCPSTCAPHAFVKGCSHCTPDGSRTLTPSEEGKEKVTPTSSSEPSNKKCFCCEQITEIGSYSQCVQCNKRFHDVPCLNYQSGLIGQPEEKRGCQGCFEEELLRNDWIGIHEELSQNKILVGTVNVAGIEAKIEKIRYLLYSLPFYVLFIQETKEKNPRWVGLDKSKSRKVHGYEFIRRDVLDSEERGVGMYVKTQNYVENSTIFHTSEAIIACKVRIRQQELLVASVYNNRKDNSPLFLLALENFVEYVMQEYGKNYPLCFGGDINIEYLKEVAGSLETPMRRAQVRLRSLCDPPYNLRQFVTFDTNNAYDDYSNKKPRPEKKSSSIDLIFSSNQLYSENNDEKCKKGPKIEATHSSVFALLDLSQPIQTYSFLRLKNSSESCYANAALQAFLQMKLIGDQLAELKLKPPPSTGDATEKATQIALLSNLHSLYCRQEAFSSHVFDTDTIRCIVGRLTNKLHMYEPGKGQQCSDEFLLDLLDCIPKIKNMYTIQAKTKQTCKKCSWNSAIESDPQQLYKVYPQQGDTSVLFDDLLRSAVLSEMDRHCDSCKSVTLLQETHFDLKMTPNAYLIVHISSKTKNSVKILECDPNSISVAEAEFRIIAAIVHYGETVQSGHYVCWVRAKEDPPQSRWLEISDGLCEVKREFLNDLINVVAVVLERVA